ncbi:hypothetical protein F941_02178 [Acinetobacter bouvetii DSM 14964 = CIP 107468]|uniref:DUF11 domain-containing protein n=1 Tax=Acinetobacter bouvetii DSM 14964 = CIP 107468 TaxID=1120925 RepID=N9DPI4_9GAMM|nr:DUF11 domain-containing protein [Acinetobacter bouvetii]ENV82378.1 hypothetical protein F941_02178 [Acinetobacter bouvetii DSM 14964 = CIP 107468]BCU64221.1 hypothetical protein ACBO_10120 [Acinetobacter bouvetii]
MKQRFQLSKIATALAVVGGVSFFGSSAMAATSTPLAGQNISNVATATYTDNTNTERVVTSNVVKTLVAQVGSFTLVQSNERQTAANSSVSFPHILTNTGNGTDSFTLNITNDAGTFDWASYNVYIDRNQDGIADDGAAALTSTTAIELAAGESIGLVVVAKTPLAATAGQNDSLILTATAKTTALYDAGKNTASNTDKATIITGAVIEIKKEASVSTIGANGYITYTLTFQNKGTAAATSDVIIYDVLPSNVTFDTSTVPDAKLVAYYNGSSTALNPGNADADGFYFKTRSDAKEAFTFNAGKLAAGSTGKLSFTVKVKNAAANGEKITNTAYADTDGFTPGTNTPLTPDNVPSVPPVTTDTTLVPSNPNNVTVVGTTAHSINDDASVSWTDNNVPAGSAAGIDDQVHAAAAQGQAIVFGNNATGGDVIYVHNSGTTADSYNLSVAAAAGSSLPAGSIIEILKADGKTPVTDNNTGPIEAGGSLKFVVRVTLPTSGTVVPGTKLIMTSASVSNGSNKDTISLVVDSFTKSAVDLVHNKGTAALPDYVGDGQNSSTGVPDTALVPGTSKPLDVTIKNTGGTPDNYNIAVEGVPTGWTAELFGKDASGNCTNTKVTNSGTIANGGTGSYCLVVTAPNGTPATNIPETITVKISSPSTGSNDSIGFKLTIAEQRAISFTPDRQGQLAPGGSIIYSHTLSNIGNVAEAAGGKTLNFALPTPAAGETVTVYVDADGDGVLDAEELVSTATGHSLNEILQNAKFDKNGLAGLQQGESVTVYVKVEAAATATAGQSYTSTVQIQPEAGAVLGSNSILSITDRTVINLGSVRLEKFQFAADCTAVPADADYTINLQNAKPGQCVFYKVTATNQGNAGATAVVINDAVPAYTTYKTGSIARDPVTQGTAPTEAGGNVNYNVGTLTPGASATLKFAVTVDKATTP